MGSAETASGQFCGWQVLSSQLPDTYLQLFLIDPERILKELIALLGLALNMSAGSATATRAYKVDHYAAHLKLDLVNRSISGSEQITLQATGTPAHEVELDADEIQVDSVEASHVGQPYTQALDEASNGHLQVRLKKAVQPGQRIVLTLAFHGSPTKGLRFFSDGANTVYSTSHWLVVNHQPSDLASLTLSLDVPDDMVVVANGRNVRSKRIGGRLISEWNEKRVMPDFVFGFAVGRFRQAASHEGNTELRYLGADYNSAQLKRIFSATPKALRFFAAKAGVNYPSRTYSQVLAPGDPEQELGDFTLLPVSYGELLLNHPEEEWLLAHELAHQWWGIGVACENWSEFWLNEGIATFMADVFLGEQFGPARYEREIGMAKKIYEELKAAGKDRALCYRNLKAERDAGGRLPYNKGAFVLDKLKQELGEDVFWKGFKEYTRARWGKRATSEELQAAMEKAARRNLQSFFDEWVYQ